MQPSIYIVTNKKDGTLYTGVTSNLVQRIHQHISGQHDGFAKKYNCNKLVYFELFDSMEAAITREKQLKAGSRKKKVACIEALNPNWSDLYETII